MNASGGARMKLGGSAPRPGGRPPLQTTQTQLRARREGQGGWSGLLCFVCFVCFYITPHPGGMTASPPLKIPHPGSRTTPLPPSPRRQKVLAQLELRAVAAVDEHRDADAVRQPERRARLGRRPLRLADDERHVLDGLFD